MAPPQSNPQCLQEYHYGASAFLSGVAGNGAGWQGRYGEGCLFSGKPHARLRKVCIGVREVARSCLELFVGCGMRRLKFANISGVTQPDV